MPLSPVGSDLFVSLDDTFILALFGGQFFGVDDLYEVVSVNAVRISFAKACLDVNQVLVVKSKAAVIAHPLGKLVHVEVANSHCVDVFENSFAV